MKTPTILGLTLLLVFNAFAADWQNLYTHSPRQIIALQDTLSGGDESAANVEYVDLKSPGKAFLFSAVVPGTGQLYAGSYLKAAGFLAIEAVSWYAYIHYTQLGKDREDQFEIYADSYWSEDKYWDWIAHQSGKPREDLDALREWEHDTFSHGLHVSKDQQYYEMIGKYDQFNYGWSDVDPSYIGEDIPYWRNNPSSLRLHYETMRNGSNQAFKHATTGVTIVILNHILSGLEAAWSVTRDNREIAQASLQFEPRRLDDRPYNALTLQIKW